MPRPELGRYSSNYPETEISHFAPVYYYLFAGIILLITVFLMVPRVAG
ncbi:MAG: hypothetical protein AAB221_08405 [Bacteroidota bacterium]